MTMERETTMEIKLGVWTIILRESNNHFLMDRVLCNDKDVDATEVNINVRMGEVVSVTVYSRGRIAEEVEE